METPLCGITHRLDFPVLDPSTHRASGWGVVPASPPVAQQLNTRMHTQTRFSRRTSWRCAPSDANDLRSTDALQWVIVGVLSDDREVVGCCHRGNPQIVHIDPTTFLSQTDPETGPVSYGDDVDR